MVMKRSMAATSFAFAFPLFLFAATIVSLSLCHGSLNVSCTPSEKEALLQFKLGLKDSSNRLSSWGGDADCCGWFGIICDNLTGHVLQLHLRSLSPEEYYASNATGNYFEYWERQIFRGNINESLLNLKHLKYLDLSNNDFEGIHVPKFLGSMESLRYLNLSGAGFGGMIPHQLGNLSNLQYLNLNFEGGLYDYHEIYVESLHWLSSLSSLEFLDLSFVNLSKALDWWDVMNRLPSLVELHLSVCALNQKIPTLLKNSSSLAILDLSYNQFLGPIPIQFQNITSLRELDLSGNYFNSSMAFWLHNPPHLELLNLESNNLQETIPSGFGNFTSLNSLDLSNNKLEGSIPSSIGNLTSLISLDLSYNKLEGAIPASFKKLCNLRSLYLSSIKLSQEINEVLEILSGCVSEGIEAMHLSSSQLLGHLNDLLAQFKNLESLDLSNNLISHPIPITLSQLTSLTSLFLFHNKLNGSLPIGFGALRKLVVADVSHNLLEGEVSEIHFANLTNLRSFDGSHNQLSLNVNPNWIPPFQLVQAISLQSWEVGPQFPTWLRSLKHLKFLDLSNSKISSTLPIWFHGWSSRLYDFNLSHNQMHGKIPSLSIDDSFSFSSIDLSFNKFDGQLPYFSSHPTSINLSNNLLSGSISTFLCQITHELKTTILNLGKNFLSGEIPDCWMNWKFSVVIELNDNYFNGKIPTSMGTLSDLSFLNLRNNNLSGKIPLSLQECKELKVLDLGENKLGGDISTWLDQQYYPVMAILNLRRNKFHGHIPKELCGMIWLQILDLANNNFNGTIPTCVSNLFAMANEIYDPMGGKIYFVDGSGGAFYGSSSIMIKGEMNAYSTILNFVRSIDLSNNKFSGDIPEEITRLKTLQSLNLSHNLLARRIPKEIGSMKALESLDFSNNQISGEIPLSMSKLTFLSDLNLSNNKLTGMIPSSTQLQSFDPSSFSGNKLCGAPLIKKCNVDGAKPPTGTKRGEDGKGSESFDWFDFYVSVAPGFVVGFWAVVGPLAFNRRWRHSYFNFVDGLWDKIMVWYHVKVVRVLRGYGF